MKRSISAVCCVAALLVCASVRANLGGYPSGNGATGNVQPLAQANDSFSPAGLEQVEMQSELLQMHLHVESADVEVDYTLHNPGAKPVNVTAGFPAFSHEVSWGGPQDVTDYHLFVDGKETPWKLESQPRLVKQEKNVDPENAPPKPFWLVSSIPFGAGETHKIHIRYKADYRFGIGSISARGTVDSVTLAYQISTAAGWKGAINKGRVIIIAETANPDEITILPQSRFHRAGRTFVWNFSDLKPTPSDDITVQLRQGYQKSPAAWTVSNDRPYVDYGFYEVHPGGAAYWTSGGGFRVKATSSLDPKKYGAENVAERADPNATGMPWAEGAPGDGVGEGLDLTLEHPRKLDEIGIINGFHQSRMLYYDYNRVAELGVSINGGREFTVPVPDECLQWANDAYWFSARAGNEVVKTIRLRIKQVYPGVKHHNACISKIYLKTKLPNERPAGIKIL